MYLAWKIPRSLSCYVDNESIPLKIIIHLCFKSSSSGTSANQCFPLRRVYLFTFMLFHFYCWVITFSNKRQTWEHYCHPHALCIVNVGCNMTRSFLPWITMFSRYLNFGGALHLCFAVSERASEIPCYHIMSWSFWQSVGIWDILLLLASWLCHWYEWI